MTTSNILLYGSLTNDSIITDDFEIVRTTGGIANVARYTQKPYELLLSNIIDVTIKDDSNNSIITCNHIIYPDISGQFNWIHISYLDWTFIPKYEREALRNACNIISVDFANLDYRLIESCIAENMESIDLAFLAQDQVPQKYFPVNTFVKFDSFWQVSLGGRTFVHNTVKIPELTFTLGAGDMLVAAVLDSCNELEDIPKNLDIIELRLLENLEDRNHWWRKQIS